MLLARSAIEDEIRQGQLQVYPIEPIQIQPASIDLRLGSALLIRMVDEVKTHNLVGDGPLTLYHGQFVLAETHEYIIIPKHLAGELVGKSSRAREGLIVESAGYFDPGWHGVGTLEMANLSPVPFKLEYLMPIAQMRFHVLFGEPGPLYGDEANASHYQHSATVRLSFRERSSDPRGFESVPHTPEPPLPGTTPSE